MIPTTSRTPGSSSIPIRQPDGPCPYCDTGLSRWPIHARINPCATCKRPMVLLGEVRTRPGRYRVRSLLDIGSSAYGVVIVVIVALLALRGMTALQFSKVLTVNLFAIGSILLTDGILAVRTRIDRTWGRRRTSASALAMGVGKIASGAAAMFLTMVGVQISSGAPTAFLHDTVAWLF